jgi:hypothetical protein
MSCADPCHDEDVFGVLEDGTPIAELNDATFNRGEVIKACPGEFGPQFAVKKREFSVRSSIDLHLVGAGADRTVILGDGHPVIVLDSMDSVSITDVTLREGAQDVGLIGGGAASVRGEALFQRVHFVDNENRYGGAFAVTDAEVTIRDSFLSGNRARNVGNGAALFQPGGRLVSINTVWGVDGEERPQNIAIYTRDWELLAVWTPEPGVDFVCDADRARCREL